MSQKEAKLTKIPMQPEAAKRNGCLKTSRYAPVVTMLGNSKKRATENRHRALAGARKYCDSMSPNLRF